MRKVTGIRLKAEKQKGLNEVKDDKAQFDQDLDDVKKLLSEARELADASKNYFLKLKKNIQIDNQSDPQKV